LLCDTPRWSGIAKQTPSNGWTPLSDGSLGFSSALRSASHGGKNRIALAATGDYAPSLRSPWRAAGDPDQPIITGRHYNATHRPPYKLAEHKTRMVIKSKTHQGQGHNELYFDDKTDKEEIYLHAQKDQNIKVLNNRTKAIDNNQVEHIGHNKQIEVKNNHDEVIGGNMTLSVGPSHIGKIINETLAKVATGISSAAQSLGLPGLLNPGEGNMSVIVEKNKQQTIGIAYAQQVGVAKTTSVGVTQHNQVGKTKTAEVGKEYSVNVGENMLIEAGKEITFKTGDSTIHMKSDGTIEISGKKISIKGKDLVDIVSKLIDMN
jgi:type VI secretion system secreted protein VgrG